MMDFIYDYTEDGLRLQGTYFESMKKDICVVFIHGMYANVIENYFAVVWGRKLAGCNIGFYMGIVSDAVRFYITIIQNR